ncbi:serine/threonine-protein kinase [Nostoc edaphicum]|uniref:serine/threonine-protein kinase n=1 Tax=Nostoc edaphicum TaxID=264686 RepID=UPI001EEC9643|nr:serine/threonine-protein kinase [Nostoc edaphicum]
MVWTPGQRLQGDKYIIKQVLGQGGFGITYKARHTFLNNLVVIKTPNESLQTDPEYPKYVKRFIDEGRRLEQLSQRQHPNIVRIRDLFYEGGTYCLVMDFVQGQSLFSLVQQQGKLPADVAVQYLEQIAQALIVVHQAGLVHRDAHPGNIMVQQDGKAVLIDFGIAGEAVPTTISSKVFANPAFAPYEQMRGGREPSIDVYSLAASLYYAITGQLPGAALERKIYNVSLIPPQQHEPSLNDNLNQAIIQGMELEPENRPQSMQKWLELLKEPVKKVTPQPDSYSQVLPTTSGSFSSGSSSQKKNPVKNEHSQPKQIQKPAAKSSSDDLKSERNVNYEKLRDLLKAGKWKEADEETLVVMLKTANRINQGWLDIKSIKNFSSTDLRTIDQLWVKYSKGKFGFSVQKRIWQSVGGGSYNFRQKNMLEFGRQLGWYVNIADVNNGAWRAINKFQFTIDTAYVGHLPSVYHAGLHGDFCVRLYNFLFFLYLLSLPPMLIGIFLVSLKLITSNNHPVVVICGTISIFNMMMPPLMTLAYRTAWRKTRKLYAALFTHSEL